LNEGAPPRYTQQVPEAKPPSAEARQVLLKIVKLRLQLIGTGNRDANEEMVLLEEIEDLQAKLRELAPDPLLPAPRPVAERRRYPRFSARLSIRYLLVNVPGVEALPLEDLALIPSPPEDTWNAGRETHCTNLSAGGIAFLVSDTVSRGAILWLEIRMEATSRIRAVASIARTLPDGSGTLVGAEFFGQTPEETETLRAVLTKSFASANRSEA